MPNLASSPREQYFTRWIVRLALVVGVMMVLVIGVSLLVVPDGRQLLYITQPRSDQTASLMMHDLDRGIRVELRDDLRGWGLDAQWSPDGEQIVYSSFHYDAAYRSVYILDLASDTVRQISPEGMDANSAAWSPDGRYIAFQGTQDQTGWDILVYDLQTESYDVIYAEMGTDGNPTWSPDSQQIAFESTFNGGQGDIYIYDLPTAGVRQLTTDFSNETNAVWSPDGDNILITSKLLTDNYSLWRVDVETGSTVALTTLPGDEYEPAISPDGEWIAFMSDDIDAKQRHIYIMRADGSAVRQVTTGAAGFRQPSFRP